MVITVEIYVYFMFMFIMNYKVKFIIELYLKKFMIIFIRTFTQLQNLYLLEKVTPIITLYLKVRMLYIIYFYWKVMSLQILKITVYFQPRKI